MQAPHPDAPQNEWLAAFARRVLRFRWPILAMLLAVAVATGSQIVKNLTVDNSQEQFLVGDSPARRAMDQLIEAFGSDEVFVLAIEGDVFSVDYLSRLRAFHTELDAMTLELTGKAGVQTVAHQATAQLVHDEWAGIETDDGWGDEEGGTVINNVTSLINVRQTDWRDGGLQVFGLLETRPTEASLPALRDKVLSDEDLVGYVVSADGRYSLMVVQSVVLEQRDRELLYRELMRITERHSAPSFKVQVGGAGALYIALNILAMEDLMGLGLAEAFALLLCLIVLYRHPIGALAPLIAVGQAVLWTLGLMVFFEMPLTLVTTVLWAFLLCVGVGGAIHVQSVYRDARRDGRSNDESIVYAISSTGIPVFLTSATTCAGLLSFGMASLPPIQHLGYLSAFGVTMAFVQTMVFVPIALSFNTTSLLGVQPAQRLTPDAMDRLLGIASGLSVGKNRRRGVLAGVALLVLFSCVGISKLEVTHDTFGFMPADHSVRDAFHRLDSDFGGSNTMSVLVEALPGKDLQDHEVLAALEEVEQKLLAYEDADGIRLVSTSSGVLDVIRQSWGAINADDPTQQGVLPPTSRGIADMLTLFSSSDPTELARHITVDRQLAVLNVRVLWRDSAAYRPLVTYMVDAIETSLGDVAIASPAGSVYNHYSVETKILGDLYRSFSVASLVITILIIAMLGDVRLGLIAMVPNLVPVAIVLGYMGWMGIRLDVQNLLVSSVVIGIAVDDTIHFMHQFKAHFDMHDDLESAIAHALQHAGRAIIGTSIVLTIGFSTFIFAEMQNIQVFGALCALAVVAALVSDLLFAPALLRAVYGTNEAR